jgi:hypothetical protein
MIGVSKFIFAQNVQLINSNINPNINDEQIIAVNDRQNSFNKDNNSYQVYQQASFPQQKSEKKSEVIAGSSRSSASGTTTISSAKSKAIKSYKRVVLKAVVKRPENKKKTIHHFKKKNRIKKCPSF